MNSKTPFISVFLLTVFVLSVIVWYSPVLFKGYSVYTMSTSAVMARNVYQTGLYSAESDLNVFLSSNLIKEQGHISAKGNKLTSLLYAQVFRITGLPEIDNFILLSIFIHALTLIIFTGLVFYLFGLKKASVFSLIYVFLPFNWASPYGLAGYEFVLLFLALFFLFYLYGIKQKKYNYFYLIIAGLFLGLSCLAREALLLIVPFLFIFLWLTKQRRYIFYIFIPFTILFAIFWLPSLGHNAYIQLFTTQVSKEVKSADYSFYGHVYPDPYTYHFGQEEFLEKLQEQIDESTLMKKIGGIRGMKIMAIKEISLFDRIKVGIMLSFRHLSRFFSLEYLGGPFIFLLILLGSYELKQKNKRLYQFFIYWIFSTIFLLSFVILGARNHLMDFGWAITLLISLGLLSLSKIIIDYFDLKEKKIIFVYLIILFVVLYNLVLVNHVALSRAYDNSNNLLIEAYAQEVKNENISDQEVIAVNLNPGGAYNLNYLTNKSVVVFNFQTIKNLLEENKLNFAFEKFKVKYILGYSNELSEEIIQQVDVINITSDSLKPRVPEISRNKGWLMNVIR